jgi:hypothetical protein
MLFERGSAGARIALAASLCNNRSRWQTARDACWLLRTPSAREVRAAATPVMSLPLLLVAARLLWNLAAKASRTVSNAHLRHQTHDQYETYRRPVPAVGTLALTLHVRKRMQEHESPVSMTRCSCCSPCEVHGELWLAGRHLRPRCKCAHHKEQGCLQERCIMVAAACQPSPGHHELLHDISNLLRRAHEVCCQGASAANGHCECQRPSGYSPPGDPADCCC